MTNREKLEQVFPDGICPFSKNWLGYEYKEPTTKNDLGVDCISRQSVLDKIQRLINAEQNNIDENGDYMNYARERVNAYEAIQFFVENDCLCPSVTPQEPKTGHWVKTPKAVMGEGYMWFCDRCEHQVYQDSSRPYPSENYCPNCGAKMVEPQEK